MSPDKAVRSHNAGRGRGGRRPGAGRPRQSGVDEAILDTTTALLRDVGLKAMTVEAVAAEVGVSVGSVYRRWPNKSSLVAAAYRDLVGPDHAPDTGSLRGDLLAMVDDTFRFFTGEHGRWLVELQGESARDHDLLAAIHRGAGPRRARLRAIFERAIERHEVRRDLDVELAIDLFLGPLWTRLLVTGEPITRRLVRRVAEFSATAVAAA